MSTAAAAPSTAIPQVEKQSFRNDSPGWLSVRVIGADGKVTSRPVEPEGIVWLTEQEQILTANAPRKPEDNPFIAQRLTFGVDGEGKPVEKLVTPLTPVTENRYVPRGDRPIPAQNMVAAPITEPPPATSEPQSADAPADHPHQPPVPGPTSGPAMANPVPVPPRAAAAAAAASAPEEETAAAATPPKEHEETGAAVQPSQEAAQGEYAALEEVGTPDAPAAAPKPYTPPEEG